MTIASFLQFCLHLAAATCQAVADTLEPAPAPVHRGTIPEQQHQACMGHIWTCDALGYWRAAGVQGFLTRDADGAFWRCHHQGSTASFRAMSDAVEWLLERGTGQGAAAEAGGPAPPAPGVRIKDAMGPA
jgi:hypothetical protein